MSRTCLLLKNENPTLDARFKFRRGTKNVDDMMIGGEHDNMEALYISFYVANYVELMG